MRISDWSSDVCSSDLAWPAVVEDRNLQGYHSIAVPGSCSGYATLLRNFGTWSWADAIGPAVEMARRGHRLTWWTTLQVAARSEEHTSELQSLMRISYAVFCLKKQKINNETHIVTCTTP